MQERLAERTLDLDEIPSVSRDEDAILASVQTRARRSRSLRDPRRRRLRHLRGTAYATRGRAVRRLGGPCRHGPDGGGPLPAAREATAIVGRGASDMKSGLAVMLEVAARAHGAAAGPAADLDVGFLFFGREELPIGESALLPLFERCPIASTIELAVVMEPTDNAIEVGCLGNLNARVAVEGTRRAQRPSLAGRERDPRRDRGPGPARRPARPRRDDRRARPSARSSTSPRSKVASPTNVIPDRVQAHVNYRYAPSHAPADAEARLRELLGHHRVEVEIEGQRAAGPGGGDQPVGPAAARGRRTCPSAPSRHGPRWPSSPPSAWTPSTSDRATRSTLIGTTSESRWPRSCVRTTCCGGSWGSMAPPPRREATSDAPVPGHQERGALSVRGARPQEGRGARGRPGADRLRRGRPPRGHGSVHPRSAARLRGTHLVLPASSGSSRAARGPSRGGWDGASTPRSTPTPRCSRSWGRKELVFSLAQAVLDPAGGKDLVLVTAPGYTIPERGARYAGGEVVRLPLAPSEGSCPTWTASTAPRGTGLRCCG